MLGEIPISNLFFFVTETVKTWALFGFFCCSIVRRQGCSGLSPEGEDGIEEEQHPVDDGQRPLGDGQPPAVGLEAAFPLLQDQHAGRDEHGAAEEREEQVDFLADRFAEQVAGKQTDQDDGVTDEGSGNEQSGHFIRFTHALVVQPDATEGEGQFQELDDRQSTNGHFSALTLPVLVQMLNEETIKLSAE